MLRQEDILETLDISRETFRYWRAKLPPLLQRPRGHDARYSTGEMLALMCIGLLVTEHDRPISRIAAVAPSLFEGCRYQNWKQLSDKYMFVSFIDGCIRLSTSPNERPPQSVPSDDILPIGDLILQVESLIHAEPERKPIRASKKSRPTIAS